MSTLYGVMLECFEYDKIAHFCHELHICYLAKIKSLMTKFKQGLVIILPVKYVHRLPFGFDICQNAICTYSSNACHPSHSNNERRKPIYKAYFLEEERIPDWRRRRPDRQRKRPDGRLLGSVKTRPRISLKDHFDWFPQKPESIDPLRLCSWTDSVSR